MGGLGAGEPSGHRRGSLIRQSQIGSPTGTGDIFAYWAEPVADVGGQRQAGDGCDQAG
jgi:hypothetical protein